MLTVGIYGCIGSGKSTLCRSLLNSFGEGEVVHIDLDCVSKELYASSVELREELENAFGYQIRGDYVDRKSFVLDVIFPDDRKYRKLMGIIVPYIVAYIREVKGRLGGVVKLLLIECVYLVNYVDLINECDRFIEFDVDLSICFGRVCDRGRYSDEQVYELMARTVVTTDCDLGVLKVDNDYDIKDVIRSLGYE